MPAHTGAESLKKPQPDHIVTLRFSEVLKIHAMFFVLFAFVKIELCSFQKNRYIINRNMSKRLWTETRQIEAIDSIQKSSKT